MAIHLDHILIPARDRVASARLLAGLLGVGWAEQGTAGPFSPVYVVGLANQITRCQRTTFG
jgi:hypothetical protein